MLYGVSLVYGGGRWFFGYVMVVLSRGWYVAIARVSWVSMPRGGEY